VHLFGREVDIRGSAPSAASGAYDALLRPEDVDVHVEPTGLGIVTHKSFLGATTRLEIGIGGANVKADVMSSAAYQFELGTRVNLDVNARDVLITEARPTS
jgi:ABC-type Fe3+/spermidine/putrescine transport system ATPase subunit